MDLYHGKILVIDLTSREVRTEELSPSILKGYLGGAGLGPFEGLWSFVEARD